MYSNKTFRFILVTILIAGAFIFNEKEADALESDIGVFMNSGFGITNNLRLSDYMNSLVEAPGAETILAREEDEGSRSEPLGYVGFDIKARMFTGNVVYGAEYGYYNVNDGHREIKTPGGNNYKHTIDLTFNAFKLSIHYNIQFDNGDFLLLGGSLGYYSGTLKNEWGYYSAVADNTISSEDTKWTIGIETGLEYNIKFLDTVLLSMGFCNRFVEVINFDADTTNNTKDDKINAGLTGLYTYVGAGYIF